MNDERKNALTPTAATSLAIKEAEAIGRAAMQDGGFEKLLKYKKRQYFCEQEEIKLGTEFVAHCTGYTKCWIRFSDEGGPPERKMFRVADEQRIPLREELGHDDRTKWKPGLNGEPRDPWVFQLLLPLQSKNDDLLLFVTHTVGGKRAVSELCKHYMRRTLRVGASENPVIKLETTTFPTRNFGNVDRPHFEIVGWDTNREGIREITPPESLSVRDELDDEIPF